MYKPSRKWMEENGFFGSRGLDEVFGLRTNHEESPEPKPPQPGETNAEVEEYRSLLQKVQVDFINYKRRAERELFRELARRRPSQGE